MRPATVAGRGLALTGSDIYGNSAVWRGKDSKPSTEPIEMELGPVRTLLFAAGDPVPSRANQQQSIS